MYFLWIASITTSSPERRKIPSSSTPTEESWKLDEKDRAYRVIYYCVSQAIVNNPRRVQGFHRWACRTCPGFSFW